MFNPQNAGQPSRPPQHMGGPGSFGSPTSPQNGGFDPASFNLENSSLAKQMHLLETANSRRVANNSRALPTSSGGGTNSAPFGGMTSIGQSNGMTAGHDLFNTNPAMQGHPGYPGQPQPGAHPGASGPPPFMNPNMSQGNPAAPNAQQSGMQRQHNFLLGVANVMNARNTPLPPRLTGVPYPNNYDSSKAQFQFLDIPTEGCFRLAGRDINLFLLWGYVYQSGGFNKCNQTGAWTTIARQFELPDPLPSPINGTTSTARVLAQYYLATLYPFEEAYRRNVSDPRKSGVPQRPGGGQFPGQGPPGGGQMPHAGSPPNGMPSSGMPGQLSSNGMPPNMMNMSGPTMNNPHAMSAAMNASQFGAPNPPHTPHMAPPSMSASPAHLGTPQSISRMPSSESIGSSHSPQKQLLDDAMSMKRKTSEEVDVKRVRQRTEGPESMLPSGSSRSMSLSASNGPVPRPRSQPSRRKIEYLPLARELDTHGGRDLRVIDEELVRATQRRPLRDINDWGNVDIEALTMSIRSRLSVELSYGLTTFTLLSTMRGQTPGSGFPIFQCSDLLEEVLDLLEEEAFGGSADAPEEDDEVDTTIPFTTHRELVNAVVEEESLPFAGLDDTRQGTKDPLHGPKQRPGNIVQAVMNVLRNLSIIPDNQSFMATHERMLDLILRVCDVTRGGTTPHAIAPRLSLTDVITIRKDALYILTNLGGVISLSSRTLTPPVCRSANRMFELIASFLVHPTEAVSPLDCVRVAGVPLTLAVKPPAQADLALDVFVRISHPDANRQVLAKAVGVSSIWRMFEALVHRLPVADPDFALLTREPWLSYLEKLIMSMYSLAFLSPPHLKTKIKTDRSLRFAKVMMRMIQKFVLHSSQDARHWYMTSVRRAIETMKVIDDENDLFETSDSAPPTLSFGVGYGEVGDNAEEKGCGMLGGHWDTTWDVLMQREVDFQMFSELESLARVEVEV